MGKPLSIRPEQLAALSEDRRRQFEDRVTVMLATRGRRDETRALVRYGIERARVHGIVREREVLGYIQLMRRFGADFDSDPRHAWAHPILSGERRDAVHSTAALLFAAADEQP